MDRELLLGAQIGTQGSFLIARPSWTASAKTHSTTPTPASGMRMRCLMSTIEFEGLSLARDKVFSVSLKMMRISRSIMTLTLTPGS